MDKAAPGLAMARVRRDRPRRPARPMNRPAAPAMIRVTLRPVLGPRVAILSADSARSVVPV
ncbi:hypothetical protein [Lysobacter gummosus]|uniref:hypothetical protein n=1 Tax=Lysobacter gummosus TaxID=262324 RepID=UPI0036391AFA